MDKFIKLAVRLADCFATERGTKFEPLKVEGYAVLSKGDLKRMMKSIKRRGDCRTNSFHFDMTLITSKDGSQDLQAQLKTGELPPLK